VKTLKLSRRQIVLSLAFGLQLPALFLIQAIAGWWCIPVVAAAVVLSLSFVRSLDGPYLIQPKSPKHLYLGLWPFFAWWAGCLAAVPLALIIIPVGLLVGHFAWAVIAVLAVAAVTGLRAVVRTPRVHEVEVAFADLPDELDGYRIAQISDVHCGVFAPEARVASWARQTTALGADLIAVTGDLIVRGAEYVDAVARGLGELAAPDGVYVAMGNHDYWGGGEPLVQALEHEGMVVLRNSSRVLRERLFLAGVDDSWSGRSQPMAALDRKPAGGFSVLLAHDPDDFDEAVKHGARLVLSGHTHGGQLGVPFFTQRWNAARFAHQYSLGHYRKDGASLYVNAGIGTSGPPIRIGVRAEIAVITLRKG
jgi:predicted MPP superfamily phosphohydrolase